MTLKRSVGEIRQDLITNLCLKVRFSFRQLIFFLLQYQILSVEVFLFGGDSFFDIIKLSPLAEDAGGIASMLNELRLRCTWSRRHFRQGRFWCREMCTRWSCVLWLVPGQCRGDVLKFPMLARTVLLTDGLLV